MKTFLSKLLLVLLVITASSLRAQVVEIDQFKTAVYHQADESQPTNTDIPNAYYFGVTFISNPNFAISLPMLFTPPASGDEFILNQDGPAHYGYGSHTFANKIDFDGDFPSGAYDYFIDYPDAHTNTVGADYFITEPDMDLYAANIPYFLPASWAGLQHLNPAVDFPLSWNNYTKEDAADYAFTFIGSFDNQTFNSQYGGFNFSCPPEQTSTVIPAGAFEYGRTYRLQLYFSNRQTPVVTNSDGSSVNVTVGFDDQTYTYVVTIPPPLQISATAPASVTLTWPTLAVNYKLQRTSALAAPANWLDVTNSVSQMGTTNSLTLPATGLAGYFRLAPR